MELSPLEDPTNSEEDVLSDVQLDRSTLPVLNPFLGPCYAYGHFKSLGGRLPEGFDSTSTSMLPESVKEDLLTEITDDHIGAWSNSWWPWVKWTACSVLGEE